MLRGVVDVAELAADTAAGGSLGDDIAQDIAGEAVRFGEVRSLELRTRHGAVTIEYVSSGAATAALAAFSGRYFGGKKLAAGFYDGVEFELPRAPTAPAPSPAPVAAHREDGGDAAAADDNDDDDDKRLDEFGAWLEQELA